MANGDVVGSARIRIEADNSAFNLDIESEVRQRQMPRWVEATESEHVALLAAARQAGETASTALLDVARQARVTELTAVGFTPVQAAALAGIPAEIADA